MTREPSFSWEALSCSTPGLTRLAGDGVDVGYVAFPWGLGGSPNILADIQHAGFRDLETVAAHEVGHGLSQGHFGKVFFDKKGNLKVAPHAVMNAVITGP